MTIKYLTVETVLSIHEDILKDTLEDKGLAPHTSLPSALHRIDDHINYDGLEDLYEIAALYGIAIAKGHCFNNGNKRTALVSMVSFLSINGIEIDVENTIIEEVMVEIAIDNMDKKQLTSWLKEYSQYPHVTEESNHDFEPFNPANYVDNPVALARIKAKITQEVLAKLMGVSQAYINEIETQNNVSTQMLKKVQQALTKKE